MVCPFIFTVDMSFSLFVIRANWEGRDFSGLFRFRISCGTSYARA